MIGVGGNFKDSGNNNAENVENKSVATENICKSFTDAATKLNELFADDLCGQQNESNDSGKSEVGEAGSTNDTNEGSNNIDGSETAFHSVKELFDKLFSDDFFDNCKQIEANISENTGESNIEKPDTTLDKITESIGTPEGIKELIEKHPEKAELWNTQLEALETLNDPDASPAEIRSAQAKLSVLKGQLMETAVKDALSEAGFDVESQQRVVEGESGGTRPDVIAKNNTDRPIEVFGVTIQPGETMCIECKCGGSAYMKEQLNNHIPNQLSGHEGTKVLLTTSDIKDTPTGLAESVCEKYGATLVKTDVSVNGVEEAIKEVAIS